MRTVVEAAEVNENRRDDREGEAGVGDQAENKVHGSGGPGLGERGCGLLLDRAAEGVENDGKDPGGQHLHEEVGAVVGE